jgi:hypothetical protein
VKRFLVPEVLVLSSHDVMSPIQSLSIYCCQGHGGAGLSSFKKRSVLYFFKMHYSIIYTNGAFGENAQRNALNK